MGMECTPDDCVSFGELPVRLSHGAANMLLMHAGGGSMKSQFKRADGSGARYALIFGADEIAQGKVAVKALRDGAGAQVLQPLDAPDSWAASLKLQSAA